MALDKSRHKSGICSNYYYYFFLNDMWEVFGCTFFNLFYVFEIGSNKNRIFFFFGMKLHDFLIKLII